MRGRVQAAFVAFAGSIFPVIGAAAVALVTLRRGYFDGAIVLLAATVGLLLLFSPAINGDQPLFTVLGYSIMWLPLVVFAAAQTLRVTVAWSWCLMVVSLCCAAAGLVFVLFFADSIQAVLDWYKGFGDQLSAEMVSRGQSGFQIPQLTVPQVAGFVALSAAESSVLALVLGRWWQAALFNPGGFRQEFLELRLSKTQALLCFGVGAICIAQSNWQDWAILAVLPLVIASFAMAHQFAAANRLGVFWLVLFYLAMLTFAPFMLGMALLSFADTWFDLRAKMIPKNRNGNNDRRG